MTLAELRSAIDALDDRIVALLNRRARLALEIGRLKRLRGLPLYDPRREAHVVRRVRTRTREMGGPLDPQAIGRVFERVIDEARQLEIVDSGTREDHAGRTRNGGRDGGAGVGGAARARHRRAR